MDYTKLNDFLAEILETKESYFYIVTPCIKDTSNYVYNFFNKEEIIEVQKSARGTYHIELFNCSFISIKTPNLIEENELYDDTLWLEDTYFSF